MWRASDVGTRGAGAGSTASHQQAAYLPAYIILISAPINYHKIIYSRGALIKII